jgi:hypothetical protein
MGEKKERDPRRQAAWLRRRRQYDAQLRQRHNERAQVILRGLAALRNDLADVALGVESLEYAANLDYGTSGKVAQAITNLERLIAALNDDRKLPSKKA